MAGVRCTMSRRGRRSALPRGSVASASALLVLVLGLSGQAFLATPARGQPDTLQRAPLASHHLATASRSTHAVKVEAKSSSSWTFCRGLLVAALSVATASLGNGRASLSQRKAGVRPYVVISGNGVSALESKPIAPSSVTSGFSQAVPLVPSLPVEASRAVPSLVAAASQPRATRRCGVQAKRVGGSRRAFRHSGKAASAAASAAACAAASRAARTDAGISCFTGAKPILRFSVS
mmetsp:Transcript_17217/g.37705  ORF Transcript_17217/g.37705 Transcript_17217/m.37705 type:complete len:235 (-) Transcript_17217:1276-1980(-)